MCAEGGDEDMGEKWGGIVGGTEMVGLLLHLVLVTYPCKQMLSG